MVVMQIRVFYEVPLLEQPEAASEPLNRGWTARDSDLESITYSKTFQDEDQFDSELADLKRALGAIAPKIEWGRVTGPSGLT
jgi:hypothetical protein